MKEALGVPVLLVEDNSLSRDTLAELLRHAGLAVETAQGGGWALKTLATGPPCGALVADHYMPGMSGLDLVRRVRDNRLWDRLPCVLVTAAADQDAHELERDLGELQPAALLRKPFEVSDLLAVLRRLLHRAPASA